MTTDIFDPATIPFMGADAGINPDQADAVVFGAPHGTPYPNIDNQVHAGAPDALRAAMGEDYAWPHHWDFDLDGPLLGDGGFTLADAGNLKTSSQDGSGNRAAIEAATASIVESGAVPIMLGGDDSTPIPFIKALAPAGPLTIIQIDAHIDWRDERRGEPLGFSSTMRRASEMAHVERIIQVGIRGLGSARREEVEIARDWGAEIITARALHEHGVDQALQGLREDANCLITFDCDALDSGIMPAVMAPTPGGLTYTQAIDLVAAVTARANLVAFDMIEFVPERDSNGVAAFTAARIVANAIGCLARR
ncbi:arginase family protein [Anderseniella sp. Alg231-50]|uniref:arginase family protein n=1 Tax=Anderseniella sp. Alg231-50 TaxID=1922226 RepID=UPI00307BAAB4